ncbi:MAG: aldo/keto reductase [Mycoplasmatales bacterium]
MKKEELKMPSIGLGTFLSTPEEVTSAVIDAIEIGYRHIDTAAIYKNEEAIGNGIKQSGITRSELFITTKVWNDVDSKEGVFKAFEESCQKLQVDYIDLYLIHWPKDKKRNAIVWETMEELLDSGKVKAIGVSNFQIHHLIDLLETAEVIPMMNQVELHPHLQQHNLQSFCADQGIALTSYGPFAKGNLVDNEVLVKIAKKHDKNIYQVILRWLYQRGIFAIPKSITKERIISNFMVNDFKLSQNEMDQIRKLNNAKRYYADPDNIDF